MKYCVAILLTLASFNTFAGLIKWVDSQGVVHITDGPPPPNVKVEKIRSKSDSSAPAASAPAAAASAPAAPKNIFERAAEMKKEQKARDEAVQKAAQEKEMADLKLKNCESARSQLQSLQNAPRVATYDEKGEPTYLDDAARQQRINEAQEAVSKNCN
ncbi:MAG TPA: DUF4124 domain-containing protein [Gallionellaceae bacterium]